MTKYIFIVFVVFFYSCGTQKNVSIINYSTPLSNNEVVEILGFGQKVPDGSKLLGTISIGDTGITTKCSYSEVIKDAQNQSRAMGGNYLLITKHKEPDLWSSCHRMSFEVYSKK